MLRRRSCAPAALLLLTIPTGIPRRRALLGRRLGGESLTLFRRRCTSAAPPPAGVSPETRAAHPRGADRSARIDTRRASRGTPAASDPETPPTPCRTRSANRRPGP